MQLSMLLILALAVQGGAPEAAELSSNPRVALETSKGQIVLELYADKAPATVENFLDYVDSEFYKGTIFHRVIKGFMVQGGGFESGMKKKSTRPPVKNESDNGVSNIRGTVAMARTADPHSATAQFFINTVNNSRSLDHGGNIEVSGSGWGYTVFGEVVEGMDVVDAISDVVTGRSGRFGDVPKEDVVILSASRVE